MVFTEVDLRDELNQLIGRQGTARSAMLPGGAVKIDGKTYEAVCESGSIEAGEVIEVAKVRNNRLVVRRRKTSTEADSPGDILSQPIDSMGIDPFEDPLT